MSLSWGIMSLVLSCLECEFVYECSDDEQEPAMQQN